jgi:hypothetical protein
MTSARFLFATFFAVAVATLPSRFDSTVEWPRCREIVDGTFARKIESGLACGSCWAYSTSLVVAARVRIKCPECENLPTPDSTFACHPRCGDCRG